MEVKLFVFLLIAALAPWLIFIAIYIHRRIKRSTHTPPDRLQEEILRALQDVDGPARIGYLEIRRIDPDGVFKRPPGRLQ